MKLWLVPSAHKDLFSFWVLRTSLKDSVRQKMDYCKLLVHKEQSQSQFMENTQIFLDLIENDRQMKNQTREKMFTMSQHISESTRHPVHGDTLSHIQRLRTESGRCMYNVLAKMGIWTEMVNIYSIIWGHIAPESKIMMEPSHRNLLQNCVHVAMKYL